MPTLDIKIRIRGLWMDRDNVQEKLIHENPSKDNWMPLHADQVYRDNQFNEI